MKFVIFSAVCLSGISWIICEPLSENEDQLMRPCENQEPTSLALAVSLFLPQQSEEIAIRDTLIDVIIYMREAAHQIEILMNRYREESRSRRFSLLLGRRRDVRSLDAESETSSSVFRAFSENLQLDYHETSKAWLYLNNFRSETAGSSKTILDRLKGKTIQLLCRFSKLIDGEGEELSPPVSNPPLYSATEDEYAMIEFEHEILREMKDYLEQKVSLYRNYERHV